LYFSKQLTITNHEFSKPTAEGNITLELFPVLREKYSGLLPGYTLNNCILLPDCKVVHVL
jgi:hypothetical protein